MSSPPPPRSQHPHRTTVIIPAVDEEDSIGRVLGDLPWPEIDEVIVVDNGSEDRTPERAAAAGARVIHESVRGYGSACLAGLAALSDECSIVAFLDGDYSDYPEEMSDVLQPIVRGNADLVIGSRMNAGCERGALLPQAVLGNKLATFLIELLYGYRYTDLGPFRAITREALDRIQMVDRDFGWTVEMQIKALEHGLRVAEIPVRYRKRVGQSKITGTLSGTFLAGKKILTTIFRYGWARTQRSWQ